MPDRRRHRGRHPQDDELFAPACHAHLRRAVAHLAWLLERGYVERSALKLVGDRHGLRERQRMAVMRATCADTQRRDRRSRELGVSHLRGTALHLDGYNVLITVEAALAGGVLLLGRDGCLRDLASLHGSFRRVEETEPALDLLGRALGRWGVAEAVFFLDRPVSNSGRLAQRMRAQAADRGWPWEVRLVASPDTVLRHTDEIVATADSAILDRCGGWVNLARHVVRRYVPKATPLDLR